LPSLLRRGAAAALYVTQDYREAMAIADRIAVLVNGRFEQVATPEAIYTAPASVAVARLFGDPTINLAEIQPFEEHGALFAIISGARIRLGASDGPPPDRPCWARNSTRTSRDFPLGRRRFDPRANPCDHAHA
jgi:multiple sugar transport system ATP-binding protein